MSQESIPQFMTLNEAAERLGVSRWTINRWIKTKGFPVVYFSERTPRVPWDQFEIWIKEQKEK